MRDLVDLTYFGWGALKRHRLLGADADTGLRRVWSNEAEAG